MSSCKTCGRRLPGFTFGKLAEQCSNCHARAASDSGVSGPAPSSPQSLAGKKWPPVTSALIGINVAVFVAMLASGVSPIRPTVAQLEVWGANWGPLSLGPQPWRILTANYVHIGAVHILLNLWCLWNLGALSELLFDRATYLLLYSFTGMAGILASLWWDPLTVGAGASAAIFGMAGALIAVIYLGRLPIPKAAMQGTLRSLLAFAGYNLFFGAVIGRRIGNSAHLGGLVAGLSLGAVLAKQITASPEVRERWQRAVFVGAGVALLAAFALVKRENGYVVPLMRGLEASQQGNLDEAVHYLDEVVAARPDDLDALSLLGSIYYQKQDFSRAEATLEHVLRLDPEDAAAQYYLGMTELKSGKADQAIPHLQKAVELGPVHADLELALGQAYEAQGKQAEADAAFKEADRLRSAKKPH